MFRTSCTKVLAQAGLVTALVLGGTATAHAVSGTDGAQLTGAQLTGAQLTGAQLTGAQLTGTKDGAQLTGAQLTGAQLT